MKVELRKVTEENLRACIELQPNEDQLRFVASNIYSLAQAYVSLVNKDCIPMPFVIYAGEEIVGFCMLSYEEKDEDDPEDENVYDIWRFMIGKNFQGKGYGKEAMKEAISFILTKPHGDATSIVLSLDEENKVAMKLYESFGFRLTGEMNDDEVVMKRPLELGNNND